MLQICNFDKIVNCDKYIYIEIYVTKNLVPKYACFSNGINSAFRIRLSGLKLICVYIHVCVHVCVRALPD